MCEDRGVNDLELPTCPSVPAGVAFSIYAVIGICAAGTYGLSTPGDIMAGEAGGGAGGREVGLIWGRWWG